MKPSINGREVVTVTVGGICLRGTYHRSQVDRSRTEQMAVLSLNHGFLPRAAPGDSAVYWADSLANSGYPFFRFDLPGLGDSDGDPPSPMLDFVNTGGYAPVLSAAITELVNRFDLSGVVIMGHCAGSVTALYSAAINKACKGLILTDPYFFLTHERTSLRTELSRWSTWSRLGGVASDFVYYLKHIRLLALGNRLPKNANLKLIRCWRQLEANGLPILVMKAPALKGRGDKPRVGQFDYIEYLQKASSRSSRFSVRFIEGTNHSFADHVGRSGILQESENWLNTYFPVATFKERAILSSIPVPAHEDAQTLRSLGANVRQG